MSKHSKQKDKLRQEIALLKEKLSEKQPLGLWILEYGLVLALGILIGYLIGIKVGAGAMHFNLPWR